MRISEKLTTTAWAPGLLLQLKAELDELSARGSLNIPEEPGGWWHQYVCPHHHTELLFDPAERDAHAFGCPHGCRIEGDAYRGAWLVFKHQAIARYALQAAAVFAGTKEPAYADLAKRILVSYAAQFPLYPVHPDAQPWMLKGRAFHQALTEAIWATTLLRAYVLLQDEGVAFTSEEQRHMDTFLAMLESSMTQYRYILIHEKKNAENNYTAWLNAALSCVYAARGEVEPLKALIEGEGGWRHHLSIGVKPDHFEFEGATYYHIFVLRAYLISAEMAERFGIDLYHEEGQQGQSMQGMFEVLIGLADTQGLLPALHDGPMARLPFAREIAEIMEIGLSYYANVALPASTLVEPDTGVSAYAALLGEVYRQMTGERRRSTLEALMYGEGDVELAQSMPNRSSLFLEHSGFVAGRIAGNKLSFLADFGEHGGSHGHYDKLHLSLHHTAGALSPDLGMVPYGSALRKAWFAETASHNTVSVGGASQAPHQGSCKRYEATPESVSVWLHSEGAYEGCLMDRHLHLTPDWLVDWFEVSLTRENTMDWWMHALQAPEGVEGGWLPTQLNSSETAVSAAGEAAPDAAGYDLVRLQGSYHQDAASDRIVLRYAVGTEAEASYVYQTIAAIPDAKLLSIETPGTSIDPSRPLSGLLQRQQGKHGRFIQVYTVGEPAELEWIPAGTGNGASPRLIVRSGSKEIGYELHPEQGLTVLRRIGA
ncbi:heparinase II/III domain-containing protein [Paenibacillus rigui]|uniref:Heparinase n=1 Tax=Paenibacillus rigui TaxID=554312 RepID=A0A229URH9_9BACL|nr:heparinase II/III family protein [Paenibacillus rigui]OXM85923.1 heparinase [Paenibacillus rigui]